MLATAWYRSRFPTRHGLSRRHRSEGTRARARVKAQVLCVVLPNIFPQELAGMHSNGYKCVAKEVQAGAGDVEQVKKEVELHNLCSQGSHASETC
eukprot:3998336-Amphidinium_carterae.2